MTANAFMSVSLEPALVLISVDRRTKMCGMLHEGSHYGVSVLCATQSKLSDRFAGRPCDDCPAPRFDLVRETPLVDGALAHFVARVERCYWGGDHSLFLGRVEYARTAPAPRSCSTAGATRASATRTASSCAHRSPPRVTGKNDSSIERSARRR